MLKKLVIAMFAASSLLASSPAFSATQDEVVATCVAGDCIAAVKAFMASLPAAQRADAARSLAAALATSGQNAGAAKANFVAALSAIADMVAGIDPALSQQIASISTSLANGGDVQTAALGGVNAASAN